MQPASDAADAGSLDLDRWLARLDADAIVAAGARVIADSGIAATVSASVGARLSGAGIDHRDGRIRVPTARLGALARSKPTSIVHLARERERCVTIGPGTTAALLAPPLSADWLWNGQSRHRIRIADARDTVAVCRGLGGFAYGGSSLALDVAATPLAERLAAWATADNGPLIALLDAAVPTSLLIEAAQATITKPEGSASCALLGVIDIDRALTLAADQAASIAAMADAGEAAIIAPTLLLGANAPAGVEGALIRFAAEIQAMTAISQALAPGMAIVAGIRVAEASMRTGMPVVATPACLRVLAGARAIAHRLGLAIAALGPATAGKGLDAQAGADTALWLAATAGYDLVLGGIGGVELDAGLCLEKLILDADMLTSRAGREPALERAEIERLAEEIAAAGPGQEHLSSIPTRDLTRRRRRHQARLTDEWLYESWVAAGQPLTGERAQVVLAELLMAEDAAPGDRNTTQRSADVELRLVQRIAALAAAHTSQLSQLELAAGPPPPRRLSDLGAAAYNRAMREAFGFKGS